MSELLNELLAVPLAKKVETSRSADYTRSIEVSGNHAEIELRGAEEETDQSAAMDYLASTLGEDPEDWQVTSIRSSEWTMANGNLGNSVKYTYAKRGKVEERLSIDEMLAIVDRAPEAGLEPEFLSDTDWGALVLIGDMQFGKADGDGDAGTLERTITCIDMAASEIKRYSWNECAIKHIHVAWLGDHIEGFNSQGGANVWRTKLTLNEQIRLTRRVMLHAALRFAEFGVKVTMAAVPGNHGEAVRFEGKGITRYDDSHDTEALICVAEVAGLMPEKFGDMTFMVPDNDELTVVTEVAGTTILHAHGHTWRYGKQFEWWKGQGFHSPEAHAAHLMVAGHYHHEHIESEGERTFIGVPSMESASQWWKHQTGITGNPGLIVAYTKDGRTPVKKLVTA